MTKITLLCFVAVLAVSIGFAQEDNKRIDSIKSLLQKEKAPTQRVWQLIWIGEEYRLVSNDSAVHYFQEALSLSQSLRFHEGQLRSRNRLARALVDNADYATALELYLTNIREQELAGDTASIFQDIRDLTFLYERIEDFGKALVYTKKLRELINSGINKDTARSSFFQAIIYNRLGSVYGKLNLLDSAKYYKQKVYRYGRERNEQGWVALGSVGLAEIYRDLNNLDSAYYFYHVGIPATIIERRFDVYRRSLNGLAEIFLAAKQSDSAFYYAQKSFSLSLQANDVTYIEKNAALLSEIYYAKNNTDSAYKYLKKSMILKDSLFSGEKYARIQTLDAQETIRKQEQVQAKREAVLSYKAKVQTYSLIAGLTVTLVIITILYRSNRQRILANTKIGKAFDELKSTQSQLIQSEKMASLGELTAGIAHEIQNPLNFVNNFSEVNSELTDELSQAARRGDLGEVSRLAANIKENEEKIVNHGKRADAIVKSMLQHSRKSSGQKELTDINALCDEYLRLSYHGLRAKDKSFNATFTTDFDTTLGKVNVIPQEIGRVVLNLINNAFYAVTEKKKLLGDSFEPTVTITTSSLSPGEGGGEARVVQITVSDNGNGITPHIKDKIFQPFFTTKPTGQGTGLGLSLSYDIVKAHGGELRVQTKEGEGSAFILMIPAS